MNRWFAWTDEYALRVGVIATVLCFVAAILPTFRADFFNAWLFAWLFWLSISLGGLAFSMLHVLTGGGWGTLIRPITTSAGRVLPLLFILFIPIFFGLGILFPWAQQSELAHDPIIRHLHSYLNPALFFVRWLIYFGVWIGLAWALTHIHDGNVLARISAPGLVLYVVLMSLAGVDWIMSRQPHWVSSVFGFILVCSQALTALCFAIMVLETRLDHPAVRNFATPKHFRDLGNLLLMLVILWAYMNFAQFLITWTGNEQPDVGWYVQRTYGGWRYVAGIIIFVHFLTPFFLLLMRPLKENPRRLGVICAALFALRILDLYWNVGPQRQADPHGGFVLSPLDLLAWIGIGGLWWATFSRYLKQAPLLALPGETNAAWPETTEPHSA